MRRGELWWSKPAVSCNVRLTVRLVRPVCPACLVCLVCAVCAVCAVYTAFIPTAALSAPAISAQEESEDNTVFWSTTLKMIRVKFPGVAQLSTDSLQTWLDESGQAQTGQAPTEQEQVERPLLLDVREKEEYEVSHLKDAVLAVSEKEALKALEGVPPDRPVVLYCSVGYRSSEMASFLQKRGFEKVYNLEGSIFAWANEGKPVYRGEERVRVVHPFDQVWGKLLKKVLRSW
ncbi:MAG: rhodanese-like domain-containing protein [Gemmatimonadetes bacterium]|nr:rhodanese-like domain-containing protein [Gemmatimonadota bacterium]MYH18345.1 rhodanese-like domain-containing protein [Gemmatimonadota bacterium]MYK98478.1 rhodanese-like domain-containing protein [Gemmatimonadota bacterium]